VINPTFVIDYPTGYISSC